MVLSHPGGERHAQRFRSDVHLFRIEAPGIGALPAREFTSRDIVRLALKLRREFLAPDSVSPIVIEGLGLELIAGVTGNVRLSTREHRRLSQRWLGNARDVLTTRFVDPPTLTELARVVGVHPVTLSRGFRRHYGCTIGHFIRDLRVRLAARQLVETETSVGEIAAGAGFFDHSHFVRAFKRLMTTTPLEYRRTAR
jgi:AraC family transcriptional regulator